MDHWSQFLTFALCHAESMRLCPVQLDIVQLMQAMEQVRRQAMQAQGIIRGPFDPGLLGRG